MLGLHGESTVLDVITPKGYGCNQALIQVQDHKRLKEEEEVRMTTLCKGRWRISSLF